ncbi:phytanoyl-CoA dioxygenase family protein [Chloroflexi bacterium TSY]|nr:phytanoyl-CoA dioxygenase family protein [Chloroflexi bacterium TSY]
MNLNIGERSLEVGGRYLGLLHDSTRLRDDQQALHERMTEHGYLLIRCLQKRDKVKNARRVVLENMAKAGVVDLNYPMMDGVIAEGKQGKFLGGTKAITHTPEFLNLVESPEIMEFMSDFLGEPAMTYDYKWLRAVAQGNFTGAHYDIVYMGRGTHNLYTVWTPLDDVSFEMGPLTILVGSHRFERIKETYGQMDVDRDKVTGWFSNDPVEVVDTYGGQWQTAEFQMGDVLIFGMFTMHGSLSNMTNRFRLSTDTRYQPADEAVDERWVGENPIAHYAWMKGKTVAMEKARENWGV